MLLSVFQKHMQEGKAEPFKAITKNILIFLNRIKNRVLSQTESLQLRFEGARSLRYNYAAKE